MKLNVAGRVGVVGEKPGDVIERPVAVEFDRRTLFEFDPVTGLNRPGVISSLPALSGDPLEKIEVTGGGAVDVAFDANPLGGAAAQPFAQSLASRQRAQGQV